jgi:hypothetical protein
MYMHIISLFGVQSSSASAIERLSNIYKQEQAVASTWISQRGPIPSQVWKSGVEHKMEDAKGTSTKAPEEKLCSIITAS